MSEPALTPAIQLNTRGLRCPEPVMMLHQHVRNLAAGGLLAGQRAGLKIPQDCAVLGFGDYPFAEMLLPSLSTIKPPALEIGVLGAMVGQIGALEATEAIKLLAGFGEPLVGRVMVLDALRGRWSVLPLRKG